MFYSEQLSIMRRNFSKNKPKSSELPRPAWLRENDPLSDIYKEQSLLLLKGNVFYATIVQANTKLFTFFPRSDHPAHILYSEDVLFETEPRHLASMGRSLFALKNKPLDELPDGLLREMARVITDERDRTAFVFPQKIIPHNIEVTMHLLPSMVFKKHLPKGRLCLREGLVPIIAAPDVCRSVMILPKKYWSKELIKRWK